MSTLPKSLHEEIRLLEAFARKFELDRAALIAALENVRDIASGKDDGETAKRMIRNHARATLAKVRA